MSRIQIKHNPDLKMLRDAGYDIEVVGTHLLLKSVPYVNAQRQVQRGTLVTHLDMAGDKTINPIKDHKAMFSGDKPCDEQGKPLQQILHGSAQKQLAPGLVVHHTFSAQPPGGYADYFHKMSTYAETICKFARRIEPNATAKTFAPAVDSDEDGVFVYADTASSRADIQMISDKLTGHRVALVGLGGTGAYVLDQVAKTPAAQIKLIDGDNFYSHNAFRSPGAATVEDLRAEMKKVNYFKKMYSAMHRRIVPVPEYLTAENLAQLDDIDFAFLSIDDGAAKRMVVDELLARKIPFVDSGIGLNKQDDKILGTLRVTTVTPEHTDHVDKKIPFGTVARDNPYITNIQVADLNALCAQLAIIRWKKYLGFYADLDEEHHSTYVIDGNKLFNSVSKAPSHEDAP